MASFFCYNAINETAQTQMMYCNLRSHYLAKIKMKSLCTISPPSFPPPSLPSRVTHPTIVLVFSFAANHFQTGR